MELGSIPTADLVEIRALLKYSEDQPRDDHGRFAGGGADLEALGRAVEQVSAGPFYHGTNVALVPGRHALRGHGGAPTYPGLGYDPSKVYLTDQPHLAERYAVARAGRLGGQPHVYEVTPGANLARDPEYIRSGFGSDQHIADSAQIVREVPLPGTVHWEDGSLMRGPANKIIKAARTLTLSSGGKARDDALDPIVARVRQQLIDLVLLWLLEHYQPFVVVVM